MKRSCKIFVFLAFITGGGLGVLASRIYFKHHDDKKRYDHEFTVAASDDLDWTKGVGEDVIVEFKSYIVRDGERVLDGTSFEWWPARGDRKFTIYRDGTREGFESSTPE